MSETALGSVISDPDGFTLYLFVPDQRGTSTCDADCIESWPPVPSGDATAVSGSLDAKLIGSVTRPDGPPQLTYNGWPLYRFVGDTRPGDTNGHGQLNAWFALNSAGGAAGETE